MNSKSRIDLEMTEAAILESASRIFSSLAAGKNLSDAEEDSYMKKSVRIAIAMAKEVDQRVSSDSEISTKLGKTIDIKPPQ